MVENFMKVLSDQPLSLALCAMNLLLLWFLFKLTGTFSEARREAMSAIIGWQKDTQAIMANCVSKESMETIVKALERDRETYRAMLPTYQSMPDAIAKVTETMIADRDKETARMQQVIIRLENRLYSEHDIAPITPPA